MNKNTGIDVADQALKETKSVLDEIIREGVRRLQHAIKLEVAEYVGDHAGETENKGCAQKNLIHNI